MASAEPRPRMGLVINAKPDYYPIELSNAELLSHFEMLQEYHQEISTNVIAQSCKFKPNPKLIDQQPEMNPVETRSNIITFLFELSVVTRVTNGIFFHSVRLYDRYCSKRIVLRDQAKLVVATCLWLAAKTWGGCNHIINNVVIPTGGRFYGPNPRARIPRLSELVHYCGDGQVFDESMFLQMERHILDTLNWNIYEPMINDYVLNVDENCLMQYELYENQVTYDKQCSEKRQSQLSQDSDATVDERPYQNEEEEEEDLKLKIKLINLKKFLIDVSAWQYDLLRYELFEVSHGIFSIINQFTNQDHGPFLMTPMISESKNGEILSTLMNGIVSIPNSLMEVYKTVNGVLPFINQVKEYHLDLQRKLQIASNLNISRKLTISTPSCSFENSNSTSIPSPASSSQSHTPMRNMSSHSDNSVFSRNMEQSSPITPSMYHFGQQQSNSICGSTVSVNSLVNTNNKQRIYEQITGPNSNNAINDYIDLLNLNESNKENQNPAMAHYLNGGPPKTSFINHGMFSSPTGTINSGKSSSASSLISFGMGNTQVI
ncbi:Cln2p [Saccharomyces cerevisiae YJM1342]|nr:Cln2p [Saccharomyces cerevisiae YJM1342]